MQLGERTVKIGKVMQHRVAEHEVEALIGERQIGGVGLLGSHALEPEALGVGVERRHHSRRDVGAGRILDDAGLKQVEAEVARAGADLERTLKAGRELRRRAACAACR